MNKNASISVIIPLYNKRAHILDTLEAVLSQSLLPLEVIVVNDGSTDDGADCVAVKIITDQRYKIVRLINQKNGGVSRARNRGIEEAKGSHVAFLDADDYYLRNRFKNDKFIFNVYLKDYQNNLFQLPLQDNENNLVTYSKVNLENTREIGFDLETYLNITDNYRANSYQRYQGEKLVERFNAYSYYIISTFFKIKNNYLLCASPERFIKKTGQQISCYPMKGTIKKSGDTKQNERLKSQLYQSEKERAENVMIVDLTRNDLSKVAIKGSVKVKELFGVYEFPQVFQMI